MRKFLFTLFSTLPLFSAPSFAQQDVPDGYPTEYSKIIDAAKTEKGLVIYSNVSTNNWAPFLELAKKRYPFLSIETTDEQNVWEKYFAESAAGARTADMILTFAPERWPDFVQRGQALDYKSPEIPHLPSWSMVLPGVYTAAADPFLIAYNKRAFKDKTPPMSMADAVAALKADPKLKGRITAYDPEVSLGFAFWSSWVKRNANGWSLIEALGPAMRPERSAATQREKIATGEQALAIFTSGAGIKVFESPAVKPLVGWGYPKDGTPVLFRSVAITKAAASPNSAKLFLDLLLSRDGQMAFAVGGQTPYRADIKPGEAPYTSYSAIVKAIGEENVIFVKPDASLLSGSDEFMARWNKALGR
ncbi:iron(III) transport system substrate-binding protein [Xaviernesmea oryzae]|uniref:Iron(III) transport system substrate-binding protein n=1 Tax=Xaviernesmea oryzae TaxID=464029 RepID=A0A1X7FPQ7_9HYPH|nr:extracellular solute-binding protein [Xaviernesmea oryzae]SMF56356.1 iron(III) transport system substrate-binding protein [Xaviernesmea oryzae]